MDTNKIYIECSSCHNSRFKANQTVRDKIIVDGCNEYVGDVKGSLSAETPFGPYECTQCGRKEDFLDRFLNKQEEIYPGISIEKEKEYVDSGGRSCPYCSSDQIDLDSGPNVDGSIVSVPVICEECGKTWIDLYKLTGITN